MWVRFTAAFDWKPKPSVTLAFLAGQERNVPTPCAEAAIKAGNAVKMGRRPKRDADQGKSPRA